MNGKGSKQRPRQVGRDKWLRNWERTFNSPKCLWCEKEKCDCHRGWESATYTDQVFRRAYLSGKR